MKTLLTIAFVSLFLMACTKERINSNGHTITETRTMERFTRVNSSGSKNVVISYGNEYKVELRGSSNLVPYFETEVVGRTLHFGYSNRIKVLDDDVKIYVTLPEIEELNLSGSGKIYISGSFPDEDRLQVRVSGSGDIKAEDNINTDELSVDISGSGEVDFYKVMSKDADVRISGSGSARLGAEDYLEAHISGSGKIYYHGNASIKSSISGSGKVIKE